MAARKKTKRSAGKSLRGRKVPLEEVQLRIEVYEAQKVENFTNAEAAERAGMGLPAWNQWKQKHRKQTGAAPGKRGRKPRAKTQASASGLPGSRVDPAVLQQRLAVFEAQQAEGFTDAEAAERAGMGLSNWRQFKRKQRRGAGAPASRGRKPAIAARETKPVSVGTNLDMMAENAQLRGRIAELEAMLDALGQVFGRFGVS